MLRIDTGFCDDDSLHTIGLELGTGPTKTFTSVLETFTDGTGIYVRPDPNESWRFRVTDQVVINPTDRFSLGTALVDPYTDYAESTNGWSLGVQMEAWR